MLKLMYIVQWYAKFEIEWTIATLLIFIVYFFFGDGPLLSLLALFALYIVIFIIVHKFLLLLQGVFFLVRGLVREQKYKRTEQEAFRSRRSQTF